MGIDRRTAAGIAIGAAVGVWVGGPALAVTVPLRVLILGGTGFIGPHFVAALTARGHTVTLFNRGHKNPGGAAAGAAGVEQLVGDRAGQVEALRGRDWDVVIDDSGYTPRQVTLTAQLLQAHVRHYIFISSISAYADLKPSGIDENYKLAALRDPNTEQVTGETYGGLKVLCERVVERTYGARCAILRPTFIAGPGDTTDRFTYWPVRVARGGPMLAPGTPGDPIQFIDVRDLADFVRVCVETRLPGRYNTCNPPHAVTIGSLLETSRRITGSDARFVWANTQFLKAQHLLDADPVDGRDFPIWVSPAGEDAGAALVSPARAVARGLRFRSLEQTIRDTLEWHKQRPADQQSLRAGLTVERETELLATLRGT